MVTNERKDITYTLSKMVARRLSSRTPYWADEVYCEPTISRNLAKRVDFMAFYPNWRTDSGVMATSKGIFEFYEIKSCMDDFNSGNGLNFEGDDNYLVCPKELAVELYETQQIPRYCKVLCPNKSFTRLTITFETGNHQTFNPRKRSTEELLFCLLMRITNRNEFKEIE